MSGTDPQATSGNAPGSGKAPPPPPPPGEGPGSEALLALDSVSASYGPYRALFGITFSVPEGGVVALLGANGAGKSTMARVVSGLVSATQGQVVLAGMDITRWPAWKIARAGMAHVPEGRGVLGTLNVEENLTLVYRQRAGRREVADALERTYTAFPLLGERRRQLAGTLSGGQQRMLSLAKVLVVPPRLLVADELSLGLAPVVIDQVYESLARINEAGTALLVVEQQVDRVLNLATRAVVLERGHVAFEGEPAGARAAMEQVVATREERVEAGARQAHWEDVREKRFEAPRR